MDFDPRKNKLIRYFKKHHRMPSYSEMAQAIGVRAKSHAHKIAEEWRAEGFLGEDSEGHIVPGELHWHIPLLGTIEAGLPSGDELSRKSVALDDWLLTHERPTYMIKVKGNSMKQVAILEGDYVLVEKTTRHSPGDIVVAKIDGSWTIKHLRTDSNGKNFLQAGDDPYSKIHPSHELHIVAVVTTVIRRLRPPP